MRFTAMKGVPFFIHTFRHDEWTIYHHPLYEARYTKVHLCDHKKVKARGALKLYQKKDLTPQRVSYIEEELRVYDILQDIKYIVPVWFHFETEQHFGIMTKYMNQDTLADYIYKFNNDYCIVMDVIYPLLVLLKQLHERCVVHRDLKPENIFIHNHKIYLGDFGYSCVLEEKAHEVIGTHQYMAPELLTKYLDRETSLSYGFEIDIWSLGIIAYELLFHRKPFGWSYYRNIGKSDPTEPDFIRRCLKAELEFPHYVSSEAKEFLIKTLQKKPDQRASVSELLELPWILTHLNNKKLNEPCPLSHPILSRASSTLSKKKSKTPCAIS